MAKYMVWHGRGLDHMVMALVLTHQTISLHIGLGGNWDFNLKGLNHHGFYCIVKMPACIIHHHQKRDVFFSLLFKSITTYFT